MSNKRADLYMGIGQAINELVRLRDHLRFGLTEDEQLNGVEDAVKEVGTYLCNTENMFRFEDVCVSSKESAAS